MKSIKNSILAISFGLLIASCGNNANCTKSTGDSTSTSSGAMMGEGQGGNDTSSGAASANASNNMSSGGSGNNSGGANESAYNSSAVHHRRTNPANDTFVDHSIKHKGGSFTNAAGGNPQ